MLRISSGSSTTSEGYGACSSQATSKTGLDQRACGGASKVDSQGQGLRHLETLRHLASQIGDSLSVDRLDASQIQARNASFLAREVTQFTAPSEPGFAD
jgi:hypothetical protein